jgi:hypothetical protein
MTSSFEILCNGNYTFSVILTLSLFFLFVLPLGLLACDKKSRVSKTSSLSVLLHVDENEMDDTSESFCLIANSLTGLLVAFGGFLCCHSTLLYKTSLVIEFPFILSIGVWLHKSLLPLQYCFPTQPFSL